MFRTGLPKKAPGRLAAVATTVALAFAGSIVATAPANAAPVVIPDNGLRACIVAALPTNSAVTTDTVGHLTGTLTCTATTTTRALKTFAKATSPRIAGTASVGRTLTAKVASWTKGTRYSYQWKAAGKKIAKATRSSYRVAAKYAGKKITVTVTGTLGGYRSLVTTSRSTGRIAK